MKEIIETNAQKDYTKYENHFHNFSNKTLEKYKTTGFYECYLRTLYFKNWKEGLNSISENNLDPLLDELHQDINSSYYLSNIGLYRTSNMHLRSLIELSLQSIYFYQHPVEFEKWKTGDFIIKHDKLTEYIKEHPRFSDSTAKRKVSLIVDQISRKWKFYSKHIHAESLTYFQTQKESECSQDFSDAEFGKWKKHYLDTVDKINTLLTLFFSDEFKRFPFNIKNLIKIESE